MSTVSKNYLAKRFLVAGLVCLAAFLATGFAGWRTITSANVANSYQSAFHHLIEVTYGFAFEVHMAGGGSGDHSGTDPRQLNAMLYALADIYGTLRRFDPDGLEDEEEESSSLDEGYDEQHLDETIELILSNNPADYMPAVTLIGRMPSNLYEAWEDNPTNTTESLETVIGNVLILGNQFVSQPETQFGSASSEAMRREIVELVQNDAAPGIEALRLQMAADTVRYTRTVRPFIIAGILLGIGTLAFVWLAILRPMSTAILKAQVQTAKERDRAVASERAKSEFLAVVSHEIRTPMNAVIGFTDLLKQSSVNETQLGYLETIRTSGNDLIGIVDEILDYSRLESNKYELESITFNPKDLTGSVARLFGPRIAEAGLDLVTSVDPALPGEVIGDAGAIRQVLFNLVSNAIKFTQAGMVAIEARYSGTDEDGRHVVEFAVTDTGIGIPKEKLDSIFQAFTQADSSDRRQYGGTGLGLAICRRLIGLMGGTIRAESTPGQGTSMRVAIPLNGPLNEAAPSTASGAPEPDLQGLNILIADPMNRKRELIAALLTSCGADVSLVHSVSEAKREIETAARKGAPFHVAVFNEAAAGAHDHLVWEELKSAGDGPAPHLILITGNHVESTSGGTGLDGLVNVCPKPLAVHDLAALIYQAAVNPEHSDCADDAGGTETGDRASGGQTPLSPPGHKGTILLAEDNVPNQQLLKIGLTQAGYVVQAVTNGKDAVEATKQFAYDIILMDRNMPVMDGIAAIELIRAAGGPNANVPILAVTASAFDRNRDEFITAGADDFVRKPIDLELILTQIENWIASGRNVQGRPSPATKSVA